MADGTTYSNTVRAGAFIVTTAIAGLIVVIILTKSNFLHRTKSYVVDFTMADGVAGLEAGAEVRVAGLKVGRVTSIEEDFDQGVINVGIDMDASITVFEDASVMRSQPLLGNYSWLNFSSLGTRGKAIVAEGTTIHATPSGGLLATIVGPQNAQSANRMFDDLTAFTGSLATFANDQYPNRVVPILDDAAALAGSIRSDYEKSWRADIGTTLRSAASAAGKLDTTMDDAKVAVADARTLVGHFREKNMAQIDRVLENAEAGVASFANALQTLDAELATRLPDLRAILQDFRTSAAQIKLATMEVRRSPWKLLYRPEAGELGRENLYEAARAFALAASDLRVAGETLDSAMRSMPERFENDGRFRKAVQEQVMATLERYKVAQQRLFDVLLDGKAPPTGSEQAGAPFAAPAPAMPAAPSAAHP